MGAYEAKGYYQLNVSVTGSSSGRVTSSSPLFECTDTCSKLFKGNLILTLKAIPDQDSYFSGWSGDCSAFGDCELMMDSAKDVTAAFVAGSPSYLPMLIRSP